MKVFLPLEVHERIRSQKNNTAMPLLVQTNKSLMVPSARQAIKGSDRTLYIISKNICYMAG